MLGRPLQTVVMPHLYSRPSATTRLPHAPEPPLSHPVPEREAFHRNGPGGLGGRGSVHSPPISALQARVPLCGAKAEELPRASASVSLGCRRREWSS